MAQFNVTITVPDGNVAEILVALKSIYPELPSETNLNYVKRVVQLVLKDTTKEALKRAAAHAASQAIMDPSVTTS